MGAAFRCAVDRDLLPPSFGPSPYALSFGADDVVTLPMGLPLWLGWEALQGTLGAAHFGRFWSWSPESNPNENPTWLRLDALVEVLLRGGTVELQAADLDALLGWVNWLRQAFLEHADGATEADRNVFYALCFVSFALEAQRLVSTPANEPPGSPLIAAPWWVPCARKPLASCPGLPAPDAPSPASVADVVAALVRLVAWARAPFSAPDPRGWWDRYAEHPRVLFVMQRAGIPWNLPAGPMPDGEPPEALALAAVLEAQSAGTLQPASDASGSLVPIIIGGVLAGLLLRWSHT